MSRLFSKRQKAQNHLNDMNGSGSTLRYQQWGHYSWKSVI